MAIPTGLKHWLGVPLHAESSALEIYQQQQWYRLMLQMARHLQIDYEYFVTHGNNSVPGLRVSEVKRRHLE